MANKYDASSIEIVENLEAVRKRPGMYIGDTDLRGFHHLFTEIIDNSIDEHLAGYCDRINVTLRANNSIIVEDNGRGIPIDIHPKTKKPAVETILTVLHAGGKFGGENSGYKVSGGLHGVGSSVVNALSEFMNVTVYKDGYEHFIGFKNGGKVDKPLTKGKPTHKQGTAIHFKPDENFFSVSEFSSAIILEKIQQLAFLNPGLTIIFEDLANNQKKEFKYEKGLEDYIDFMIANQNSKTKALSKTFSMHAGDEDSSLNISFKYVDNTSETIKSFVNNIHTHEGGSHEKAFKVSLVKAFNDYAQSYNLVQKQTLLEYSDLKEGLIAIISLYLVEKHLQFEGQTKAKLSSKYAYNFVEKIVYNSLIKELAKNPEETKTVIEKAYIAKKAKDAARKAREATRELSKSSQKSFAGKLVPAQSKRSKENEIFLVEGDSAGGSAKLARNRRFQAILPLKGKIVNTEKSKISAIVTNEELLALINSIGTGFGSKFNIKNSNYGKIIIMTDADTDGAHIQTLILTFFFRYMRELIDEGLIYIALPPLYKVNKKASRKDINYFWTDEELNEFKQNNNSAGYEIQRYKGLGEMNYEQLWETTMDPKTRKLVKVNIDDFEETNKIIETLMGQDASLRKEWINENIEFNVEDNFEISK